MDSTQLIPSLMVMTIGGVLLAAIVAFALFLRKRRNRDLAARAFQGDDKR